MEEARAGVGGLGAEDAVELGRMADRLVHLERICSASMTTSITPAGHSGACEQRGRLLADARRLALEPEAATNSQPACALSPPCALG